MTKNKNKKSAILDTYNRPLNLGSPHLSPCLGEYMRLHEIMREKELTQVPFFKERLGPQQFTTVAGSQNRRYWVWYDKPAGWMIFVHPVEGLTFYVLEKDMSPTQEKNTWGEFLHKVLSRYEMARVRGKR
jgi:hypothetical protein